MLRKFSVAAIVGVLVITGIALPASAEEEAEEIVDVVQQAEEDTFDTDIGNVDVVEASDGDFEATVEGDLVEIPEESDDPIEIESDEGALEIDFPGTINQDGKLVGDSVAYPDVGKDLGIVVDATEDGVRVSAVIETTEASHVLDFGLTIPGNGYLQLEDDDSVSVRSEDGTVVHSIAPPWATDANGTSVETWYEVDGDVLTQHVKPTAVTAYPITADPQIHDAWWGQTVKFTRAEFDKLKDVMGLGVSASALGVIACAGVTGGLCAIPWAVGGALLALGSAALVVCGNDKGVDIHVTGPSTWCSGY